jgi:WD40 repeat protein
MSEISRPCLISIGTYEGHLVGISLDKQPDGKFNYNDIVTEYNFTATEGSVNSACASGNLLILGGFNEVVRLFDAKKKKDLGDLMGDHNGSITSLALYKNKYMISAAEDSEIIIYRCKDWTALHQLSIMNKSPIVAISLHPSGKMLLALYANGVLRLWNLMEARCKYKRKVNVITENAEGSESEDPELADIKITTKNDLTAFQLQPLSVQWEPSQGEMFAVIFNNLVEVYNVNDEQGAEKACSTAVFDVQLTSLAFISQNSIIVSDIEGNLHLLQGIESQTGISLKQINTKFEKIRTI